MPLLAPTNHPFSAFHFKLGWYLTQSSLNMFVPMVLSNIDIKSTWIRYRVSNLQDKM